MLDSKIYLIIVCGRCLFLILTSEHIPQMITAAKNCRHDVFVSVEKMPDEKELLLFANQTDSPVLCFLPGRLFFPRTIPVIKENCALPCEGSIFLADIQTAGSEMVFEAVKKLGIGEILIPFAELVFTEEYGFSGGIARAADIKNHFQFSIHTTALFSAGCFDAVKAMKAFGGGEFIAAGEEVINGHSFVHFDSRNEIFPFLIKEAEKNPVDSTAVFFPTRRQAAEFSRFCNKSGLVCPVISGETEEENASEILNNVQNGKIRCLSLTKSAIPLYLTFRAKNVIFCGFPFSTGHIERMKNLSADGNLTCVYCDGDFSLAEKLSEGYAQSSVLPEYKNEFLRQRAAGIKKVLEEIKEISK